MTQSIVRRVTATAAGIIGTTALFVSPAAQAQQLNLLCNAAIDWCELMKNKFEAETGIKTNMTRRSSGESYAQIRAEAASSAFCGCPGTSTKTAR